MLIQKRFCQPIRSGEVSVLFRRWGRLQVRSGGIYRTAAGRLEVIDIVVVTPDEITDVDAGRAGYADAAAVVADLRGESDNPIYQIESCCRDEPDPRTTLANTRDLGPDDVAGIDHRLARLDQASRHGPWTSETVALIATHPEQRAPDLAAMVGRESQPFKLDARKLKNLGLTLLFRIGYRLSPRGIAYLEAPDRK